MISRLARRPADSDGTPTSARAVLRSNPWEGRSSRLSCASQAVECRQSYRFDGGTQHLPLAYLELGTPSSAGPTDCYGPRTIGAVR